MKKTREQQALERDRDNGQPLDAVHLDSLSNRIVELSTEADRLENLWKEELAAAHAFMDARATFAEARSAAQTEKIDSPPDSDSANANDASPDIALSEARAALDAARERLHQRGTRFGHAIQ